MDSRKECWRRQSESTRRTALHNKRLGIGEIELGAWIFSLFSAAQSQMLYVKSRDGDEVRGGGAVAPQTRKNYARWLLPCQSANSWQSGSGGQFKGIVDAI